MPRWFPIVAPILTFVLAGAMLPLGVLMWLVAHHEPPYVLDRDAMTSSYRALGGQPVTFKHVSGPLDDLAGGGMTADYGGGSTASIVTTSRPERLIAAYGAAVDERSSSSTTVGGFTRRDARLRDGRFVRAFGTEHVVFVFVAPTLARIDALVAQSAIRPNMQRDVGNRVLDDHTTAAVAIGCGWFAIVLLATTFALVRALSSAEDGRNGAITWTKTGST